MKRAVNFIPFTMVDKEGGKKRGRGRGERAICRRASAGGDAISCDKKGEASWLNGRNPALLLVLERGRKGGKKAFALEEERGRLQTLGRGEALHLCFPSFSPASGEGREKGRGGREVTIFASGTSAAKSNTKK